MSSTNSDDSFVEKTFDWNKYLFVRNADEVPDDFFYHVCKSEQNGIELGSVVEIENEDQSGYWFATVCSSKGVLINLHYFGDDNDKHDFWLEVKSSRIHSLNWGSENNKKLISPFSERFLRFNPKVIKEKVQDCEHVVSNSVLKMKGAPIYNIFKRNMFVEVQDKEYPYRVWISKVLKNVGGRLFLQMQGIESPEKEPFWLFYLNERVFPLGWAEQKGLPWRVMNLDVNLEDSIDSSVLLDVLKPKTPEQHGYKVGEMLEVINPCSLMVFYVATIVKIYDNRYFKVEVDNEIDVNKRFSFVATKENPYLFIAGWASKHQFLLKPPSDWKKTKTFSWSEYILIKNSNLANVDNTCRKKIENVHIGMKLEAVDPLETNCIRVATVKGFADHWMFLSFDRSSWSQELLHLRSVYSDEVFPVGWCSKHTYSLSVPKFPYNDSNDFEHCYYSSDVDIDLSQDKDQDNVTKYPHYLKGGIFYHFSKKENLRFGVNNEGREKKKSKISKTVKRKIDVIETIVIIKEEESPELDEEFHDALFINEDVDMVEENINTIKKKPITVKEVNTKKYKEVNKVETKIENISKSISKTFCKNNYKMCIYFNKDCYPGSNIVKRKIAKLPNSIGPGVVSSILQEAISIFVELDYFPWRALKKIKQIQDMLFNGPGGIEMLISTNTTRSHSSSSEYLLIPESKKMAQTFCSTLCSLSGMCEFFMTTEEAECFHGCNKKKYITPVLKTNMEIVPISMETSEIMAASDDTLSYNYFQKRRITNSIIARVAAESLDWSNTPLVERYNYYMGCLIAFETHILRLNKTYTELESAIVTEIQSKKNDLRMMDYMDVYSNTKSELDTTDEDRLVLYKEWKLTFENFYRSNPRFKKFKIDIGQVDKIEVKSNPKYWSPDDVYTYLTKDIFCNDIALKLFREEFDGVAFMLLNEEQLLQRLRCTINLAIRIMCHVAEVKLKFIKIYCQSDSAMA